VNLSNSSPSLLDALFALPENSPLNALAGTVTATDPDIGDLLTYRITAGNASGAFAIDSGSGMITVADPSAINFETTQSFLLTVEVADQHGAKDTANVTVQVTNVNETPSIPTGQSFPIAGSAISGTVIGTVAATDPDTSAPNKSLMYGITSGNATGAFAIDPLTGQIKVGNAISLQTLSGQVVTLQITVTDGGAPSLSAVQNVAISVSDASSAPELATPGAAATFIGKVKTPVKVTPTLTVSGADGAANLASIVITLPLGAAKKNPDVINLPGLAALGTRVDTIVAGRLVITITLNNGATNADVQHMLRDMTFQTKGKGLKVSNRTFELQVTNRTGLHSNVVHQTFNVLRKSPKSPK
jgi:hypothetical protein